MATKLVDGCAPRGKNGVSYPISSMASSRGLSVRRLTSSISIPSTLPSASRSNTADLPPTAVPLSFNSLEFEGIGVNHDTS